MVRAGSGEREEAAIDKGGEKMVVVSKCGETERKKKRKG